MYVTLLLLAPAVCEWVEISQQHYRKPVRYRPPVTDDQADQSTNENFHHYEKPPRRQFPITSTESNGVTQTRYQKPVRSQYFSTEVVTEVFVYDSDRVTPRYRYSKPVLTQHLPPNRETEMYVEETTTENSYHHKKRPHFPVNDKVSEDRIYPNQSLIGSNGNKGKVNKVPKLGNVQRVHLDNNVVKAPNVRTDMTKDKITNINSTIHLQESNLKKPNIPKSEINRISNNIDYRGATEEITKFVDLTTNKRKDNVTIGFLGKNGYIQNNAHSMFVTQGEPIDFSETFNTHNIENTEIHTHLHTSITSLTKPKSENVKDKTFVLSPELSNESRNKNSQLKLGNKQVTPNLHDETNKSSEEDYATVNEENDEPTLEMNKANKHYEEDEASNKPSNDSKANTMENLMTLMKVVAETIRKNTRKSVNSKTTYLTNLKNTILNSIKERIDSTWPDDPPELPARSRATRDAQATPRGHLEIPSSESALMTISFLTFAVFLIKLVLQVIQTYKNKTMMVTPAVVATVGRMAAARKLGTNP